MERPPKKYVCEKCGYLGDTSEHEGCDYLAWTTGEQLCIDQLERELALLKASPASAPEGFVLVPVEPTEEMLNAMFETRKIAPDDADLIVQYNALLAASPTPPVSEDQKDAERLHAILETLKMEFYIAEIDAHHPEVHAIRKLRTSLFAKLTEILKTPVIQEDKP